jgi:hypothetical protein
VYSTPDENDEGTFVQLPTTIPMSKANKMLLSQEGMNGSRTIEVRPMIAVNRIPFHLSSKNILILFIIEFSLQFEVTKLSLFLELLCAISYISINYIPQMKQAGII